MTPEQMELAINSLSAETMALQAAVVGVCAALIQQEGSLATPISNGLDAAARFVEDVAIATGKRARPEHTVKAVRVVEELRAAIFGDKAKPRHIV